MTITDVVSLFGWQFLTGLLLSGFVPLLGIYLRMRDEWLAALGLTHVAAAGGVVGVVLHWPVLGAAMLFGMAAAALKAFMRQPGNSVYAAMILFGWALLLLIAANHHHAHILGQALIDGQLYFTGRGHLLAAVLLVIAGSMIMWNLSARLLREVLFPGHQSGNDEPVRIYNLAFDLLVAVAMAITAIAVGIMATFALVLLPAWAAFGLARDWRAAARIAVCLGMIGYLLAFVLAIWLDQPFGPVLVVMLLALTLLKLRGATAVTKSMR